MPAPKLKTPAPQKVQARKAYEVIPQKRKEDDPDRYTKNPHDYGEVLLKPDAKGRTKLGGALQRDLYYWISKHTWGTNVSKVKGTVLRPEYAKLSLGMLARLTGSDRRTVARSLADLEERGIIEARERKGCGPTTAKMYKLTPERWKAAKYYEPKAVEQDEADEPEEEIEQAEAPEAATVETEATVAPGKSSKPQSLAVQTTRTGPPVTIKLVYQVDDFPEAIRFSAHPGTGGKVHIRCRATAPQRFAESSPAAISATAANTDVNDYSRYISEFVFNFWGKSADQKLISAIVSGVNGAPLSFYENVVSQRFAKRGNHTTGLLIALAKDAAAAWEEHQRQTQSAMARKALQGRGQDLPYDEAPEAPAAPQGAPCAACKGKGHTKAWSSVAGVYAERKHKCAECHGTGRKSE